MVCHPKISGMLLCKSKIANQFREQALFGGKIWLNDKIKKENYFGAVASNAINSFSAFYLSSQKSSMKKYYSISTPLTCCLQSCLFVLCCRLPSYMSLKKPFDYWTKSLKPRTGELVRYQEILMLQPGASTGYRRSQAALVSIHHCLKVKY